MAEIEHRSEMIPLDDNYQARCEELKADGWQTVPGTTPVAVFSLFREKPQPGFGAHGKLKIDDSLVQVVRNGQIVG